LRILAGGNVGIGTANPAATLDVNGTIDSTGLSVNGGIYASGINSGGGTFQNQLTVGTVGGSYLQYQTFSFTVITSGPEPAIIKSADLRVESDLDVLGSVNSSSSRDLKTNFAPADVTTTLKKVLALPLQTWRFTNEVAGIRHLGPMSQDFYSAFNLGKSERFISSVDEGGVALAAIQGLNQKVEEKDKEIQELKTRLEKLEQFLNSKTGETK
jgi:hypothetical protein